MNWLRIYPFAVSIWSCKVDYSLVAKPVTFHTWPFYSIEPDVEMLHLRSLIVPPTLNRHLLCSLSQRIILRYCFTINIILFDMAQVKIASIRHHRRLTQSQRRGSSKCHYLQSRDTASLQDFLPSPVSTTKPSSKIAA